MAKLDAEPGDVPRAAVMKVRQRVKLTTWRGKVVIQKWPRRRGKPKSPLQQAWVDQFSTLACLTARADGWARDYADGITEGTLWYWRDVVMKAALGQFITQGEEIRMGTPTVHLRRVATQTIVISTETDLVPDTEDWDTNAFWSPPVPTSYIVFKSGGLYLFGGQVEWATSAIGQRQLKAKVNGTDQTFVNQAGVSGSATRQEIIGLVYAHANDQLKLSVFHNASGNLALTLRSFWAVGITPESIIA